MTGTLINAGAIVLGGVIGLTVARNISERTQHKLKLFLGLFTIYAGMSTTWGTLSGSFGRGLKVLGIACLALILGNILGKLLHIQKSLNKLGRYARDRWTAGTSSPDSKNSGAEGFVTCTLLFCVGPMAIIGPLQDALNNSLKVLAIKSAMDGVSTIAFSKTFGAGVMLAALPVLAYQGTITLGARLLRPLLERQELLDPLNATGGLLILCTSVLILDLAKPPLGDYLPALVVAPVLAYFWM